MDAATTHIYLNHIKADRAEDWEAFARSVIAPAISSQRPELRDRVQTLRSEEPDEDGSTVFAFLFEGGDLADYDLEPVFTAHYGAEEGGAKLEEWADMYARDQYGWTFRTVPLHG